MSGTRARSRQLFTTQDLVILALFAALIALSKAVFRIPIHVPGHSGIMWMAILLVGRGVVRKPWAGTMLGLVSGILAVAVVGGREGLLLWMKYLAPGAIMDLAALLSGERLSHPIVGILSGAVANAAKLVTSLIVSLALGIPTGYLALGLGLSATTHIVFGALGGWLGTLVLEALRRARAPLPGTYAREEKLR
ncbi:MAG: cobalt ABC transporter permease [Coriobacteriia bacterium]|nr:cobalt ABC transporter permease [Coriobacteriia bacterium]